MKQFFNKRSTSQPKPFRWIIDQRLAVGPIPNPNTQTQLLSAGIRAVLTLCAEQEGTPPAALLDAVQWTRYVLPDSHYDAPLTVELLEPAVEIVRQAIVDRLPIYVHCFAGIERSPTVCVAYLCKYEQMQPWEALNSVKQSNPRTGLTPEQVRVIQALMQSGLP
jgi:atypical dual specificity phosphatase